jgi:hypothetical protein
MAEQWFYSQNGKQCGLPVSFQELRRAAVEGGLLPTDLVWRLGMAEWVAASTISGLFGSPPPLPPPLPSVENRQADPFDFLKPDGPPPAPTGIGRESDVCILAYMSLGLVCLSFVTTLLLAIPGVACGHVALAQCKHNPRMKERNYAVAALVAGYAAIGLIVLAIVAGIGLLSLPSLLMHWHR